MSLARTLRLAIREKGPITVHDYMRMALRVYYNQRDPLGREGDFTTAPEISQIFGEMIGVFFADAWQKMERPKVDIMELGPGRGTLMKDALRATRHVEGFLESAQVHFVEINDKLKRIQRKTMKGVPTKVFWHEAWPLRKRPLLLVANEFFDALPIRQFQGEQERRVGLDENGNFCFIGSGDITEACPAALEYMKTITRHLRIHKGVAVIIDYGYGEGQMGDTLQAVKSHKYHPVLQDPGKADITAHVNFKAMREVAEAEGAKTTLLSQCDFLHRMGGRLRLEQLCKKNPQQAELLIAGFERLTGDMGQLFKVLIVTP